MSLFTRAAAAAPDPDNGPRDTAYGRKKKQATARSRAMTKDAQEISPLPPVVNPERRAKAIESFRSFLEAYFPDRFNLAWSTDHIEYIADIQHAVNQGGLQATALPRGSGKTTIAECAMIWGALKGTVPFGLLIGSTKPAAVELLDSIRTEFEGNDLLLEDFPEACHPIRRLEGINQRRLLFEGQRIRLNIGQLQIILPNLPGSPSAGAIIRTAGLTGRVRGMKFTRPDGVNVRPSFVLLDDPQTDKSARSDKQCQTRAKLIRGAVLGLAGPRKKISAVMPCTIVRRGDLADQFLDRQKSPEWHGRRAGLLKSLPTRLDLWQEYWEIRCEGLRKEDGGRAGIDFFAAHRRNMDEGAEASWPERFNPDELSAIQHFMNLYLTDRLSALAEYMNDPEDETQSTDQQLDPDAIVRRTNGHKRGEPPTAVEYLSVGIDVQKSMLFWLALGSETKPTSYVIDFGSWPKQRTSNFALRDASRTLQTEFPDRDLAGQLYGGLETLVAELAGREWKRADGTVLRVGRCVIDARYEPDTVFKFAKQSEHRDRIVPAQGLRTGQLYMDRKPKSGTKHGSTGDYKLLPAGARPVRHILLDSSRWISRVVGWLRTPVGSTGALTLFEAPRDKLQMFAEHACAEYSITMTEKGTNREIVQWQLKPGATDNHLLDCLKLAAIGNYEQGTRESIDAPVKTRRRGGEVWNV